MADEKRGGVSQARLKLHARHCPDDYCGYNGIDSPGARCHAFEEGLDLLVQERRSTVQEAVAGRIRAELVCCDIYARVNDQDEMTLFEAMTLTDYHDVCYWAEASARIAEGRCPGYETEPNICRCPCGGCRHNCSAHQEGEEGDG